MSQINSTTLSGSPGARDAMTLKSLAKSSAPGSDYRPASRKSPPVSPCPGKWTTTNPPQEAPGAFLLLATLAMRALFFSLAPYLKSAPSPA